MSTLVGITSGFLFTNTYAQPPIKNKKTATVKNLFFCPPIKNLKKNPTALTWTAKGAGGWKSYEISFVTKIAKFIGAQWVGADYGQLTCLYHGKEKTTFPILLIFHTLTQTPSGGKWSHNLGGYYNCKSAKQQECPFKIRLRAGQTNIIQEAEQLKNAPPPQIPGS